jgi:hypothetical protein
MNGATATPVPGAGHDYIHLLSETVDPSSGNVSVRITLPTPPGRGLTIPFSIAYDSGSVHRLDDNPTAKQPQFISRFRIHMLLSGALRFSLRSRKASSLMAAAQKRLKLTIPLAQL